MNLLRRLLNSALLVAPIRATAQDPYAEKRERLVKQNRRRGVRDRGRHGTLPAA